MVRIAAMLFFAVVLVGTDVTAQRQNLSIQGVLRDATGASVPDASYTFTFRLYTVASGGSVLWTEDQTLSVVNGVYSTTLGKVNNTLRNLDYNAQYWLGISVNSEAELTPRTELTLSPYAILAGVQGVSNVIPESGNVGIGTTAPSYKLQVVGAGYFDGSVYVSRNNTTGGGIVFSDDGDIVDLNDGWATHRFSYGLRLNNANGGGSTTLQLGSAAGASSFFNAGNVGIGTSSPGFKLDVTDRIRLRSGAGGSPGIWLTDAAGNTNVFTGLQSSSSTSPWGVYSGNGWRLTLTNGGGFGVGTTNPSGTMHVLGTTTLEGWVHMSGDPSSSKGNTGIGGTNYGNVKLTVSSNQDFGIYSSNPGKSAGYFVGNLGVTGSMSKGGGSFKIDHPLDPANKFLYHSFVESPDMMNVYNGNVTTDASGSATITLPTYFESLNRDFRYQLTVIGQFAQAIVESEVSNNRFSIKTDKPNVKVSWQVTGIRQDAFAKAHPVIPEVDKSTEERGKYLHPVELKQPESLRLLPVIPAKVPATLDPGQ